MGEIDFDPFSCAHANQVVNARAFCAPPQDGFTCAWDFEGKPSRVFCNPPGGKLDRKTLKPVLNKGPGYSSAAVAWAKLVHEYELGNVQQAVFIGFNLELLRTSQGFDGIRGAGEFPCCFPKERLRFWNQSKDEAHSDPTCANVIVYVPPSTGPGRDDQEVRRYVDRFREYFSPFGTVLVPVL
jgi:hypothetical protein